MSPANADPPRPTVNHEVRCTADGTYRIEWTVLAETAPTDATRYRFVGVELHPAGTTIDTIAPTPEGDFPHSVGKPVIGTQTVPGTATVASLALWIQWDDGYDEPAGYGASVPLSGRCGQPPSDPTATFQSRCDGSVLVDLANPPAGRTVELMVTSVPEGFVRTVTLAPGKSAKTIVVPREYTMAMVTLVTQGETLGTHQWTYDPDHCAVPEIRTRATCDEFIITVTAAPANASLSIVFDPNQGREQRRAFAEDHTAHVSFPATPGLAVTLRSNQFDPQAGHLRGPYTWEQPAGCGDGGGGGLPVTGQSTGALAATAGLLLVVGAALLGLARRRRVRFTA
ncbi:LPXTG cell wall anchor domain-containing protein [Micromonospora profundi]|uniref:LPXTG cell wall anchor domain-containing protein n=1 Tax=Micromonospora TaxID=1873 RepID=UPI0033B70983